MEISEATKQLLSACEIGDLDAVKQGLAAGADVLVYATHGLEFSPFLRAVEHGHLEIVKYLIHESGRYIAVTAHNNLAIRVAAENAHLDIMRYFLHELEQATEITSSNTDRLGAAAQNDKLPVVRFLLEECHTLLADRPARQLIDATAENNYALRWAASNGNLEVVKYLIEDSGQPVDITALRNWAARMAALKNRQAVLQYLIGDSGQLFRMLQADTDWLADLQEPELKAVAVYGFGLDPEVFKNRAALLEVLRHATPLPDLGVVTKLLTQVGVENTLAARKPYVLSTVCRQIATTGLVSSRLELDRLLCTGAGRNPAHAKKL